MSQTRLPLACSLTLSLSLALSLVGCGKEAPKYEPKPAVSGLSVQLPPVPTVPAKPTKDGDAYTVWGASYALRNRVHQKEVEDQKISIVGYIVKSNITEAPECAVHKGGTADPEGCKAPVPTFWIADEKGADLKDAMKVMGWASNFANVFDAIKEYDTKEDAEHADTTWGVTLPKPLPAVGAKVKIEGNYSTNFTMASAGAEADPIMGILTYGKIEYLEQAPELATLPGVERKEAKK